MSKYSTVTVAVDSDQRIYEWRGASPNNKYFEEEYDTKLLNNTYRCPIEIIEKANPYLEFLSGEVMGTNVKDKGEVVILNKFSQDMDKIYKQQENVTFISRTNPMLFAVAETMIGHGYNIDLQCGTNFEGVEQHFNWLNDLPTKDKLLSRFSGSAEKLVEYYSNAGQMGKISQLISAKKIKDINLVRRGLMVFDPESPTAILTNPFVAKGLEWDNVAIVDTFNTHTTENQVLIDSDLKYLYVAITRAKKKLYLPSIYDVENVDVSDKVYINTGVDTFISKYTKIIKAIVDTRIKNSIRQDEMLSNLPEMLGGQL